MGFCGYLRTLLVVLLAGQCVVWSAGADPLDLAGSEWGLPGQDGEAERFVQFGPDGAVSGSSGCNRFAGTYRQNGDELTLGPLATTRMACPPEVMEQEQQFLTLLGDVRYAEASHPSLILKDADGKELAELVRRDGD